MMPCNWLCYVCKKIDWLRNGSGSLSVTGATGQSSTPMAEWVKFYDKGQFTDESQTATPGIWTPPSCSTEAATFCLNYDGADLDAAAKFKLKPGFDGPLSGLLDDTSVCEADNRKPDSRPSYTPGSFMYFCMMFEHDCNNVSMAPTMCL